MIRPPANRTEIAGGASRGAARAPQSAGSQTDAGAGACSEGSPSPGSPLCGVPGRSLRPGTAVGARNENEESFFRKRQLVSSM